MKKTNFDLYLEEQLRDPDFAERFKQAGEAWDVALQLAALREQAGLSQVELARKLKTTQQQISRLESPSYEGHSLSMLRRVARVLNAHVRVVFEPEKNAASSRVAERSGSYRATPRIKKGAGSLPSQKSKQPLLNSALGWVFATLNSSFPLRPATSNTAAAKSISSSSFQRTTISVRGFRD